VGPIGFAATIGATTLAPGDSTTLTVTLLSPTAGAYGGKIFLDTNDRDEDPFELSVMGIVENVDPALVLGEVVVDSDNDDVPPTFAVTGDFRYQFRDTQYVNGDYRYTNVADTGANARWTLNFDTPGPRTLEIGATWAGSSGKATNAPFRFYESDGTTLISGPVLVDQT
jgi:hypothetical protein